MMGPDAMILVFWMLNFKPTFSLSSFTFIKRFYSSLLSAIRVVSSAYLRSLIFLLAILILACASSSPAFLMRYSAFKLNKQGNNIQPWHTPFPIWNQSIVPVVPGHPGPPKTQEVWDSRPLTYMDPFRVLFFSHSVTSKLVLIIVYPIFSKKAFHILQASGSIKPGCVPGNHGLRVLLRDPGTHVL